MLEREGKLLGCAMLQPLERGSDGVKSAELAAFCVHPSYRGSGRGDSLLDFLGELVLGYWRYTFPIFCTGKYSQCLGLLREEVHAIKGHSLWSRAKGCQQWHWQGCADDNAHS